MANLELAIFPSTSSSDILVNCLAGGIAGAVIESTLFPLDRLKTLQQLKPSQLPQAKPRPASFLNLSSIRTVYRGMPLIALASFPSSLIFFSIYETTKGRMNKVIPPQYSFLAFLGSAAVANTAACVVRVPFEGIKQRLQAGLHSSSSDAIRTIYRTGGYRGFFVGYISTVTREVPFDALDFTAYEYGKLWYGRTFGEIAPPYVVAMIAAASGAVSAMVTNPLDVVKTRMMTSTASFSSGLNPGAAAGARPPVSGADVPYKGVLSSLLRIRREEGWRALYAGCGPRTLWVSAGGAVFFGIFESLRQKLRPLLGEAGATLNPVITTSTQ